MVWGALIGIMLCGKGSHFLETLSGLIWNCVVLGVHGRSGALIRIVLCGKGSGFSLNGWGGLYLESCGLGCLVKGFHFRNLHL